MTASAPGNTCLLQQPSEECQHKAQDNGERHRDEDLATDVQGHNDEGNLANDAKAAGEEPDGRMSRSASLGFRSGTIVDRAAVSLGASARSKP